MEPSLETLAEKKFIGQRINMSFADNKTFALWSSFMPARKAIPHQLGTTLYSIELYPPFYFQQFDPQAIFEKWAAVEVVDFEQVPESMETIVSPEGLYAVFTHLGPASSGPQTYQYIFGSWLPHSDFLPDDRPHFAMMGDQYKHDDPDAEETIWIPLKPKV